MAHCRRVKMRTLSYEKLVQNQGLLLRVSSCFRATGLTYGSLRLKNLFSTRDAGHRQAGSTRSKSVGAGCQKARVSSFLGISRDTLNKEPCFVVLAPFRALPRLSAFHVSTLHDTGSPNSISNQGTNPLVAPMSWDCLGRPI